jgi:Uncharacterized protein conserved in bacteria (DUF2330)
MRTRSLTKALALAVAILVVGPAGAALACGGLVAPNGTVSLTRTTTLAAYHDGVEHYLTSFEYAGETAGDVGSIVPLPGVPTRVIKGGGWTLQRLEIEVQPPLFNAERAAAPTALFAGDAQVLLETTVDSLDITVLKGGAVAVGTWATDHGFFLPPDAPEVLDFYAERSPIFMAAAFDADAAAQRGQAIGDGTPVHLTIPTDDPWVPLRILALGKSAAETVQADVYLLTDEKPALLPNAGGFGESAGLILDHSAAATESLLTDLRSDDGMGWVPDGAWLTKVVVDASADELNFDLAIDASGGKPSPVDAGLSPFRPTPVPRPPVTLYLGLAAALVVGIPIALERATRPASGRPPLAGT